MVTFGKENHHGCTHNSFFDFSVICSGATLQILSFTIFRQSRWGTSRLISFPVRGGDNKWRDGGPEDESHGVGHADEDGGEGALLLAEPQLRHLGRDARDERAGDASHCLLEENLW